MAATLAKALPYLFVHEADEKKGGAPLATLKLELQDEAQRTQLFDDRRVTQWHRKSEFQMISLIEIAEDMLKHSPKYLGQVGFSLYMPGSVHERKLTFRTPVLLYASSNNPGAEAAASELLEQFKDFHVTSEPPKSTALARFRVGDRVMHKTRGPGQVIDMIAQLLTLTKPSWTLTPRPSAKP